MGPEEETKAKPLRKDGESQTPKIRTRQVWNWGGVGGTSVRTQGTSENSVSWERTPQGPEVSGGTPKVERRTPGPCPRPSVHRGSGASG